MLRSVLLLTLIACAGGKDGKDKDPPTHTGETTTEETDTETQTTLEEWPCEIDEDDPDFSKKLGCNEDFLKLASLPLDASIPGARSAKTIVDTFDNNELVFINSVLYPIHYEFASQFLSGNGLPIVGDLSSFNAVEYYSPDRRFLLGAVTYYEGPDVWAYDVAPYDTADAEMIATAFNTIRDNAWFGPALAFHPASRNMEEQIVPNLPDDIPIVTTDDLFADIDYQPLNLGTTMGQLAFLEADSLRDSYVNPCELVVLDSVPNDISVTAGIITQEFQTPLAHINVLSQNRGTPNMGLKGAFTDPELRGLEGKWVELDVGAFGYTIREVDAATGQAYCDASKPEPLIGFPMDLTVQEITNDVDILNIEEHGLGGALDVAIPAFGGKASHFGGLVHIGDDVPMPKGFAIPVYFYNQFMEENGFYDTLQEFYADPVFQSDPAYRALKLEELQNEMRLAPLNASFRTILLSKLNSEFPNTRMRFRSSTNAEDLGGFTGAGLYTSKSGDPNDPDSTVEDAIRNVWASVWNPRAYEERDWYGIVQENVGMALLCHRSFPDEEANGVAITANIFDVTGLEPGFYVNVQEGGESVVLPDPGIISDQFLYYFESPNQPIVYLAHSNLIPQGETVLTTTEAFKLGTALSAIHSYFYPVYGVSGGFYAMDTEFKFEDDNGVGTPELFMKQARPYPGRGEE